MPATVEYVDIPGIATGEGAESLDLAKLKTVDALLHVVRAFEDPEIPHAGRQRRSGARRRDARPRADPRRPLRWSSAGSSGSTRPASAALTPRGGAREDAARRDRPAGARGGDAAARGSSSTPTTSGCCAASSCSRRSRCWWCVNVGEGDVASGEAGGLRARRRGAGLHGVVVSAPIEARDLAPLAPRSRRSSWPTSASPSRALDRVIRASYELLGVHLLLHRRRGRGARLDDPPRHRRRARPRAPSTPTSSAASSAPRWCAGTTCSQLKTPRRTAATKALLRLEGKEYVVHDGDVVHFRFNV